MGHRSVGPITARSTFVALRQPHGRARSGPLHASFIAGDTEGGRPSVGFAISKRCGGAVQRNLIRRRLRGALEEIAPGVTNGSYLIRTDAGVINLNYTELIHNLKSCMKRAGETARRGND